MEQITISRRSKLGFGYETAAHQTEKGLAIDRPTRPYHTGTVKQIAAALEDDKEWQLIQQGTYYRSAWFVRVNGQWRRVEENIFRYDQPIFDLLRSDDGCQRILWDTTEMTVNIEPAPKKPGNAAARALGSIRTAKKSATSAANGRKGGRPRKDGTK